MVQQKLQFTFKFSAFCDIFPLMRRRFTNLTDFQIALHFLFDHLLISYGGVLFLLIAEKLYSSFLLQQKSVFIVLTSIGIPLYLQNKI